MPNSLTSAAPAFRQRIEGKLAALLWAALSACGGALVDASASDAGTHRDGARPSTRDGAADQVSPDEGSSDDFPVFHEDACPDVSSPRPSLECDPFAQTTCPLGLGCYPIPPRASDSCHPGTYATLCLPAGTGAQGAPCTDGTDCAPGFICVVSGQGDECVRLCRTNAFNSCTDGRVCREVDVTGSQWGGCE